PSGSLPQFDEGLPFTFRLTSLEPAFASYTEPCPDKNDGPEQSVFYFDNAADHHAELFGALRQLLHPPGNALQSATLPVRPKLFSFTLPATASGGDLQIVEPLTRQLLWKGPVATPKASLLLDLRDLAEGRYILELDGKELLKFYLSDVPP